MKSATLCDHGGGTSDVKQEEDKAKLLLGSKLQVGDRQGVKTGVAARQVSRVRSSRRISKKKHL